ncbi:MAG: sigma-70 family RNA polymerase sigma factor [Candidatus Sericytochromatia bacterium]|nr:sigma-70 family RNA polymerase sigma factor [Candidatus Sericytochromatia bacterium]
MITMTSEEEEKATRILLNQYKESFDSKIKNALVKAHLSLVEKIARNHSQMYKEQYDDLVQVGCLGLLSAIERFDLQQKVSFKTYSTHFISGEMKHYIRDHYSLVKQPRELQELQPKVNRAKQFLRSEKNVEPNAEQISEYLELPIDKIEQVLDLEKKSNIMSLDQQINQDADSNSASIISQLEDKKYQSFQLAQEDKMILSEAIKSIKDQSRQVIEYAFYQDLSQTEIAKQLGISQMQVSRRLKGAVKELWEILNTRVTPW